MLAWTSVACGGDGDNATEQLQPLSDGTAAADVAAGDSDKGDRDVDDIIGAILRNVFGGSDDTLDDSERQCMNGELAPVFPEGVLDDIELTDELADTLDAAAETCGAEIGL